MIIADRIAQYAGIKHRYPFSLKSIFFYYFLSRMYRDIMWKIVYHKGAKKESRKRYRNAENFRK